ncbi:MAG: hypothetical protein WA610_07550 [Thermodesulfovibrionales bacterium]
MENKVTFVKHLLKAISHGFWLGVLNRKDLWDIDYYYYAKLQKGYQDSAWNLTGLFEWEKIAIESYFKGCHSIMITGAGAGREAIALEKMGYAVDAFECNPDLVKSGNAIMKEIGINARLELMPRDGCPEVAGQYDGIVLGWTMYMFIQEKKSRIEFLTDLHEKIRDNGPLLVSFYPRSHGSRYHSSIAKLANSIKFILNRKPMEVGGDFVDVYNFGHYFTEDEIASEITEAGFQLAHYCAKEYKNLHNDKTSIYGWAVGIKKAEGSTNKTAIND